MRAPPPPLLLIDFLWLAFVVYWYAAARGMKRAAWRASLPEELAHRLPLAIAVALLFLPHLPPPLMNRIVTPDPAAGALGVLLALLGLGFAIRARRYLGGNWSGRVMVKEGHTLVTSGPYRVVRHPIYTGLLLAFLGTALALGELRGFLALPILFAAFLIKSRQEEARMRATFPDYDRYAKRTPALIPFLF
jgi:protein-S-isoprenylcysteine O-methyltransferase Ste14